MIEHDFASRKIAVKIGCKSYTTILWLKKKYEETGIVKDKQHPGWPPKLNEHNERTIIRHLMIGECITAVSLIESLYVNEDIEVSVEAIYRMLRKNGFAARVKCKKPLLSKKHHEKRLNFAKRFKNWTVQDWSKVVWSDESKFQIFSSNRWILLEKTRRTTQRHTY